LRLGERRIAFKPDQNADLQNLAREIQAALKLAEEKPKGTNSSEHSSAKKLRRGLQEADRLAAAALAADADHRKDMVALLLETVAAINNSQRPPVPGRLDAVQMPFALAAQIRRPIGHGRAPAANLQPGPPSTESSMAGQWHSQPDLSLLDPKPSTFWRRPANIAAADLFHGFGRSNRLEIENMLCDYSKPKDSYGLNPGFEVECRGVEVKLKFGEISSEPLTARVFAALGYHADPTDYCPQVLVRYDRRIFQEFHSRKPLRTRFTLLGVIPFYTLDLQKRFDPFDYIRWAVLRDGRRWSGRELKAKLFRDPARAHPEDDPANFREDVEAQIAQLVTVAANVQAKDAAKTIGPWDFGQLDHAGRRELRGAGLLAAWLGWFDTRFDNTRLKLVRQHGHEELAHYFSDLGGGLGKTSGLLYWHGEQPNAFPWSFTRPPLWQGSHLFARPLRISRYHPMAYTDSFAAMTIDDARWMARLIGQLTEPQIVQALVGSGYDSAEVRLYAAKLVSRRDRMIADLGLAGEIPPLRAGGVNHRFAYDPSIEGPATVLVPGEGEVKAPVRGLTIRNGKLMKP
jgi:hypothetical protein